MKILYIVRGLPGAGKSTLAQQLVGAGNVFENNQYFTRPDGTYEFVLEDLPKAEEACVQAVEKAMQEQVSLLAVANVFVDERKVAPYRDLARNNGYRIIELVVRSSFVSEHSIPQEALSEMRKGFKF